jgi:hypothetical protein
MKFANAKILSVTISFCFFVSTIPVWGEATSASKSVPCLDSSKCKVMSGTAAATGLAAFGAHRFANRANTGVDAAATRALNGQSGEVYFDAEASKAVTGSERSSKSYWDTVRSEIRNGNRNLVVNYSTDDVTTAQNIIDTQEANYERMQRTVSANEARVAQHRADFSQFIEEHKAFDREWAAARANNKVVPFNIKTIPDLKLDPVLANSFDDWVSNNISSFDLEQRAISSFETSPENQTAQINAEKRQLMSQLRALRSQDGLSISESLVIDSEIEGQVKVESDVEIRARNAADVELLENKLEEKLNSLRQREDRVRALNQRKAELTAKISAFEKERAAYLSGERPLSQLPKPKSTYTGVGIDAGELSPEHMELALREEERLLAAQKSDLSAERLRINAFAEEARNGRVATSAKGTQRFLNLDSSMTEEEALRLVSEAESKPGSSPLRLTRPSGLGAQSARALRGGRGAVMGIILVGGAVVIAEGYYVNDVVDSIDKRAAKPNPDTTAPAAFGRSRGADGN